MLALRFPFAASSGVLVTLAVFSLLWHFVSVPIDIPDVLPTVKVDWKRLRKDTPFEVTRDERIERPDPPRVPDPPPGPSGETGGTATPYMPPGPVHVVVEKTRGFVLGEDRDAIPIVRVAPEYPPGAIAREPRGLGAGSVHGHHDRHRERRDRRRRGAEEDLRRRGPQGDRALALQPEGRERRRGRARGPTNGHPVSARTLTKPSRAARNPRLRRRPDDRGTSTTARSARRGERRP